MIIDWRCTLFEQPVKSLSNPLKSESFIRGIDRLQRNNNHNNNNVTSKFIAEYYTAL